MSPTGMTESVGDSQIHPVPISDSAGLNHQSNSFSTDGANKNQLAFDYVSSAFHGFDFQNLNLDFESLIPYMASQNSPSTLLPTEPNVPMSGHGGMYDSLKIENAMSGSANSMFGSVYQNGRLNPGVCDPNTPISTLNPNQFSALHCSGMFGNSKYGSTDFESLQQKISQKKQTLDFLQGVLPDPLANQEKRYMTMTERIQVPTSDHVAEIVGKNGQRIKQLREQLKVWVKTPSRDEPPVFEVTGLPEKLAEAKRIILQMSEHFTKVQQERLHRIEPNRIEDRLYVEQDKVGLIVGASGQTIRWVQQLSDTHIATPRKQESIPGLPPPQTFFTICGTPEKVKFAKQLICEYVTLRCQGLWLDPDLEPSAEASRLVREFHQRRQVEDSQRRTTSGQTPSSNSGPALSRGMQQQQQQQQGRPLVGASDKMRSADFLETGSTMKQLIGDMEELWGPSTLKTSAAASSTASSGQESPRKASMWNPMLFGGIGLAAPDRRFSADAHAAAVGFGFDSVAAVAAVAADPQASLKKSLSDEQVSPQVAGSFKPGQGWM